MIEVTDIEQGTSEWLNLRLRIPTASEFKRILTSSGNPSKSAEGYMEELVYERLTGNSIDRYVSYDMQRGKENEPEARRLFELVQDMTVRQVALCYMDDRKLWSCSPDGLIDPFEGLEIKDAKPRIQIHRLRYGWEDWKTEHYQQIQGGMLITGRSSWYLMSNCPGLPPLIIKVERDTEFIIKLKVELEAFCEELDRVEDKLRRLG